MSINQEHVKKKFLRIFSENSGRVFLVNSFTDRHYTYREFLDLSLRLGNFLKERGIAPGDKVVYILPNGIEAALFYFASVFTGAIAVPVNPSFNIKDIKYIIESVDPTLIVCTEEITSRIKGFLSEDRILQVKDCEKGREAETGGTAGIFALNILDHMKKIEPFDEVAESDPVLIIVYTSGTTSRPKGVVHRLSSIIHNAAAFCAELDISCDNRFFNMLPMTYLGGYYNLLFLPFTVGASVVIGESFGPKTPLFFWDTVEKYEVNTLWLVPTIMAIMLKIDRSDKGPELCRKSIKRVLVGTAPLPLAKKERFENKYGIKLYENYGLSETLFISSESPRYPFAEKSVGHVVEGVEAVIKDESGSVLPVNSEGEIWIKSPYLMDGYYDAEKKGPEALEKNNWFPTGDIGYLAPRGEIYVTDRKKDLIIKGGLNVSSKSIEDTLHEYSSIEEALVVGIPHDIYGEDVVAVIKFREGIDFKEEVEKLKQFCKDNLSSAQCPSRFFEINEFPTSYTGKIQKFKLKNMLLAKVGFDFSAEREKQRDIPGPGGQSTVPGKVKKDIKRPPAEIIKVFNNIPTSIVSDSFNRLKVMKNISPVKKGTPFFGPAFTVEEVEGGNLMSHIALEHIQAGDVLVIDAKGTGSRSCWGGLLTRFAQKKKVAGIVVNGYIRDLDEITELGVPVYALGTSPAGPLKGWGGFVNFPISCAGVPVLPGDIVVGDDDGIVVVAHEFIKEVLYYCQMRMKKEEEWFQKLEEGKSTIEIVGLREQIKRLNIEYI